MNNLHLKFVILVNAVDRRMDFKYISELAKDLYSSVNTYLKEHKFGGEIKKNLINISDNKQNLQSQSLLLKKNLLKDNRELSSEESEKEFEKIYGWLKQIQEEFKSIEKELKISLGEILP